MAKQKFTLKADIELNWKKAINFIPKFNELIIYEPDETYEYYRVKVGNGIMNVNELPFVTAQQPEWKEF